MTLKSFVQQIKGKRRMIGASLIYGTLPVGYISSHYIGFDTTKDHYIFKVKVANDRYSNTNERVDDLSAVLIAEGIGTKSFEQEQGTTSLYINFPKDIEPDRKEFILRGRKFISYAISQKVGVLKLPITLHVLFADKESDSDSFFEDLVDTELTPSELAKLFSVLEIYGLSGWCQEYVSIQSRWGKTTTDLDLYKNNNFSTIKLVNDFISIVSQSSMTLYDVKDKKAKVKKEHGDIVVESGGFKLVLSQHFM